ncbi:hypothetical protein PP175_08875 [Aneurinibacillus sp. Ricciae_BoGa-3]|uniref:hypothetical protein n=1 Tax=Aneurinibacillus sp. Ricciae_BoGa-3 TaxID=3022697 RepID=UPI0023424092|nr:hypothetical protein [Aneurinibacillus sp. Ricciae_BoGa-3]WCK56002.1 hypothetical protein PP175_08875 [Aneurinibacillus sp. Ricciae_BoGa-3]
MTRKKYSLDFKKQVVKEVKETGSITAVAGVTNHRPIWSDVGKKNLRVAGTQLTGFCYV